LILSLEIKLHSSSGLTAFYTVCTSVLCGSKPQDWVAPELFAIFSWHPREVHGLLGLSPRFCYDYILNFFVEMLGFPGGTLKLWFSRFFIPYKEDIRLYFSVASSIFSSALVLRRQGKIVVNIYTFLSIFRPSSPFAQCQHLTGIMQYC
jgi:hypothetical protein